MLRKTLGPRAMPRRMRARYKRKLTRCGDLWRWGCCIALCCFSCACLALLSVRANLISEDQSADIAHVAKHQFAGTAFLHSPTGDTATAPTNMAQATLAHSAAASAASAADDATRASMKKTQTALAHSAAASAASAVDDAAKAPIKSAQKGAKVCVTARQGTVTQITCPEGSVVRGVSFASFGGRPARSSQITLCDRYRAHPQCHTPLEASVDLVRRECVEKQSCSISQFLFAELGDPCQGFIKYSAAVVTCVKSSRILPKTNAAQAQAMQNLLAQRAAQAFALSVASGGICPLSVHAAAPMRMCLRYEACTKATVMAKVNRTVLGALSSFCPESMRRQTVTMIWMTDASTFGIRNQYSLESLLRHHPCVHVQVVAPLLPHDFFLTFRQLGYNVTVQRFNAGTFEPFKPAEHAPGDAWVSNLNRWRSGAHFAVHKADVLRMLILYKMGGSYMDFDHIVLRPMLHISNGVGSEICHDDNPDCMSAEQIEELGVAVPGIPIGWSKGLGAEYSDRIAFRRRPGLRYTPCNGVLINWKPRHKLFGSLLRTTDENYDPGCWGCLGPRLLGKVLLRALGDEDLLANVRGSFSLLYPAMLYPFSYESVRLHVTSSVEETEHFVHNISALGVHFFGGSSAGIPLVEGSTMGKYTARNTFFGVNPAVWLVRKAGQAWCHIPPPPKTLPRLSDVSASLPRFSFPTFPGGRRFAKMASESKVVLLCHPDWLGIREATFKTSHALHIPVVLAADLRARAEQDKFEMFLRYYKLQAVLVQGIPPGTLELAKKLRARRVASVGVVYHSGIAVHNIAVEEAGLLGEVLQSAYLGDIYLGFLERDQASWAQHLIAPACAIPSTFQPRDVVTSKSSRSGRLRIGLLGTGTRLAVKNFFTQLGAACMVPGAEVHVNSLPPGPWNEWHVNFCAGSIIVRGGMSSDQFTKALAEMDINLYVSWTDAVPNVVSDSLASGVPVITSDTSPWFDASPLLRDMLVEPRIDDPHAIYQRMLRVLEFVTKHRALFFSEVKSMMSSGHREAVASWKCFIHGLSRGTGMCRTQDGRCKAIRLNPAAQYEQEQRAAFLQASSLLDKWQRVQTIHQED